MKYQYCCQNAIAEFLHHVIPIPDFYEVKPECLSDCGNDFTEEDYRQGFKTLSEMVFKIYEDMLQFPEQYGLPLVEDIDYGKFNPKAKDSLNSSKRLINLLNNISAASEISTLKDCLIVSKDKLNTLNKSLKSKDKIQNVQMIIKNLCNFGFVIIGYNDKKTETFTIHTPDNKNIILALKGYMQFKRVPILAYPLHYYLAASEESFLPNNCAIIFSNYLIGEEKRFFEQFNEKLLTEGFTCKNNEEQGFVIEYRINETDEGYLVRCHSEGRKLKIILRLRKFENYLGELNEFSSEIKALFSETTCTDSSEKGNHRFSWVYEGNSYSASVYTNFSIKNYNKIEIIDEYVKLLCMERFWYDNRKD